MNPNNPRFWHQFNEDFIRSFGGFYGVLDDDERKLIAQIKQEAIEYFTKTFNIDMKNVHLRKALPKEQKERVVAFMKERLKWYNENGFVLSPDPEREE